MAEKLNEPQPVSGTITRLADNEWELTLDTVAGVLIAYEVEIDNLQLKLKGHCDLADKDKPLWIMSGPARLYRTKEEN